MKKISWLTIVVLMSFLMIHRFAIAETLTVSEKDACTITCYQKTPTCYVKKDASGCLDISYTKPVCNKDECVCKIPGCEQKTIIDSKGNETTIKTPNIN